MVPLRDNAAKKSSTLIFVNLAGTIGLLHRTDITQTIVKAIVVDHEHRTNFNRTIVTLSKNIEKWIGSVDFNRAVHRLSSLVCRSFTSKKIKKSLNVIYQKWLSTNVVVHKKKLLLPAPLPYTSEENKYNKNDLNDKIVRTERTF